jgi:hypothetical protein
VNSYAFAQGGYGALQGGAASAAAIGHGTGGTTNATAATTGGTSSAPHAGDAISSAQATASAVTATTTVTQADLHFGNAAFAFTTTPQAVANADLAPVATSSAVHSVLAGNLAIKSLFGASPSFYALGEAGAGHSAAGSGVETNTSTFTLGIDQANVSAGGHLIVGLFDGTLVGSVSSVSLAVTVDGVAQTGISFTGDTAAQATLAFDDMAFDLGPLAGTGTLDVQLALSVTTDAAGSGFYGGFIIGDPPAAHASHAAVRPDVVFASDGHFLA